MRDRYLEYEDMPFLRRLVGDRVKLFRVLASEETPGDETLSEVTDIDFAVHISCNSRTISRAEAYALARFRAENRARE